MPGKHSNNWTEKGTVPRYPPQLPKGREENSPVPSPFSTLVALVSKSLVGEGRMARETANCFWMEFSRQGPSQRTNGPSEFSL